MGWLALCITGISAAVLLRFLFYKRKAHEVDIPSESGRIELRVHGIGDHDYLSGLGSPPTIADGRDVEPDTVGAPNLPKHTLRLLNWSRTSRRTFRFAWYLALPFTLLNVAGHMAPQKTTSAPLARSAVFGAVILTLIIVTACAQIWLIAIGETILRDLAVQAYPQIGTPRSWAWGLTGALAAAIAGRTVYLMMQEPAHGAGSFAFDFSSGLALVVVLTIGWAIQHSPPTRWAANEAHSSLWMFQVVTTTGNTRRLEWDALAVITYGSMALVGLIALLLLGIGAVRSMKHQGSGACLAGAALALVSSITLLNAFAGAARQGVELLMRALDNSYPSFTFIDWNQGPSELDRLVMSLQNPSTQVGARLIDNFPTAALLGLVILAVTLPVLNLRIGRLRPSPGPRLDRVSRKRYWHRVVCTLPSRLPLALLLAGLAWTYLSWLILSAVIRPVTREDLFTADIVTLVSQLGAVIVVAFIAFRFHAIRYAFAMLGDVVGFWPVIWHPLAGHTYRHRVVKAIRAEFQRTDARKLALVGHSQGSVISAWALREPPPSGCEVHLITCGSPIRSLYETFFPGHVNEGLYKAISVNAKSWKNFWRATDPIATDVGLHGFTENQCLVDPPPASTDPRPRAHGDYWIEVDQVQHIANVLSREASAS
jgi:hypothetical protein